MYFLHFDRAKSVNRKQTNMNDFFCIVITKGIFLQNKKLTKLIDTYKLSRK